MLDSLHIKNFRCFEDLTIPSLGRVNLIVGKNNVGKTTLLEGIYVFTTGGSAWAMYQILNFRNQFFANYQQYPKQAIDSLKNIFWDKEYNNSNNYKLSISDRKNTVDITYDIDIYGYAQEHSPLHHVWFNNSSTPAEGFYIKRGNDYTISTPQTITGDLNLTNPQNQILYKTTYNGTMFQDENSMASLWDKAQDTGADTEIENVLRIIEPRLSKIYFTANESNFSQRIARIKLQNPFRTAPLKSLGEGMTRLLQIFLNLHLSKDGILLIDEFENGLHYSIQDIIWKELFKIANSLNVQVFVSTHSEDTIKAFCKVALASEEEGRLIALGRSPAPEDNGRIVAVSYDEKEIAVISRTGIEVR